MKFFFAEEVAKNYFCHFATEIEADKSFKLDIQRYYVASDDEIIDIRMKYTSKKGE